MPVTTRARRQALEQANPQADANRQQNEPQAAPYRVPRVRPAPAPPTLLPYEKLKSYVLNAKLPNPSFSRDVPTICRRHERITPPDRHLLSIEPDSRFRLKEVWVSKPPIMATRVRALICKSVPSEPIPDAQSRGVSIRTANFNLPAPGFLTFVDPPSPISQISDVASLIMGVLETAERVVNLVWPEESKGFAFTFPSPDCPSVSEADASLCIPLYYQQMREQNLGKVTEPKVKIVVIVLAPWAIALVNMHDMLSVGALPAHSNGTWPTPALVRALKVWTQIYQCCASQNCPFFILTTYDKWIFGSFQTSSGWSRAVATPVVAHTSAQPSVLEWITYWCYSALQIDGAWSANKFLGDKNPEIHRPTYIQSDDPEPMTNEEWMNRFYMDDRNEVSNLVTKMNGRNVYVTHF